jgi:hypothetical protein
LGLGPEDSFHLTQHLTLLLRFVSKVIAIIMLSANSLPVAAVCLSLFARLVASQETQWIYDIPPEEEAALASIVEDVPEDIITLQAKDWLSPEYPLIYKVPLPIPPVKEPTK